MNPNRLFALAALVGVAGGAHALSFNTYYGVDLFTTSGNGAPSVAARSVRPNHNAARTNFLAQLINPDVEDFEGADALGNAWLTGGASDVNNSNSGVSASGRSARFYPGSPNQVDATFVGDSRVWRGDSNGTGRNGRWATSGRNYIEKRTQFRLDFTRPIAAFGFSATDVGDFQGQVRLSLVDGNSTLQSFEFPALGAGNNPQNNGNLIFFGVIAKDFQFNRIEFFNTNSNNDEFGFDDFTIASSTQVVPEPATLALGAAGLAAAIRRRRARRG